MFYATTHEFGNELAVHVFNRRDQRDAWINSNVLDDVAPMYEYGPREAVTASEARRLFSEGAWEAVETVTTHSGCRPRGLRRRQGCAIFPEWLDKELDLHFSASPRGEFGHPDWTRDVLYQRTPF